MTGWINVSKNINTGKFEVECEEIYDTKEEALSNVCSMFHHDTVMIEWKEREVK